MTDISSLSAKWARLVVDRFRAFMPGPVRAALNPVVKSMIHALEGPEKHRLEIEPEDVFLVSFPRSGNTWMRHMLTLVHPGVGPTDERDIHHVIPSLDADRGINPNFDLAPRPRVIKSHSSLNPSYPRVIYLLRDGRDATHSFYLHRRRKAYAGSFRDFLLSGATYGGCSWYEHVESWLSRQHGVPLLLVRYEDMLDDPELELRRAIDFLGWEVTDEDIKRSVAESSIDRMREMEKTGVFLAHVGQGKAGQWRERYSREELRIFMNYSADTLRGFGYIDG